MPLWALACSGSSASTEDGGSNLNPGPDGGTSQGPRADAGPYTGPDPDTRFLTEPPPYPACAADHDFHPQGGYSGLVNGQKKCGPASPNCPTTYIEGNTGAPCSSPADCTGKDPVCLTGSKYPGGVCSATGCEYGSNFGCPKGDFCLFAGDGQTYCVDGCGIDEGGCFQHCRRDGFACFTSESNTLGYCLGAAGTRACDPSASPSCTNPSFGDGICGQSSWDDQSIGNCFETCDVLKQDCSRDGQACYLLFEYKGYPVCFQSQGEPEGSTCVRTTECGEGLRCSCDDSSSPCTATKHCRTYCSTDGKHGCPSDRRCRPLAENGYYGSCEPN